MPDTAKIFLMLKLKSLVNGLLGYIERERRILGIDDKGFVFCCCIQASFFRSMKGKEVL
jgi:hypothetical protein